MPDPLALTLALLLPTAVGSVWLALLTPTQRPGTLAMILGYGHILGLLYSAVLMLAVDAIGIPLSFTPIIAVLSVTLVLGLLLLWYRPAPTTLPTSPVSTTPNNSLLLWLLAIALGGLLLIRFTGFALEIVWRPLYPWDAWMNWAPKAKVWFEQRSLVEFVHFSEWLQQTELQHYTSGAWHYPPLVPMLQLWIALALERWDEALINLPWLSAGIALGLAFYGQLRLLGLNTPLAVIFTYLLLSVPMMGIHIVLAGYADIWLALLYLLASLALLRWLYEGERGQAVVAILLIAALPLTKIPGLVWLLAFIPALAVALLPIRWLLSLAAIGLIGGVTWLLSGGFSVDWPGLGTIIVQPQRIYVPNIIDDQPSYNPEVWAPLLHQLGAMASWHLLAYILPIAVLLALWRHPRDRGCWMLITLLITSLLFLALVFFFSHRSDWIIDATTTNRALLPIMPLGVLLLALAWRSVTPDEAVAPETPSSEQS